MIKYCTKRLKKHLPRLYNRAIKPHEQPPPNWRDTTVKSVYKSRDSASPPNCRPMCSIPILYKLCSQLLFKRQQPALDASHSIAQAGFSLG